MKKVVDKVDPLLQILPKKSTKPFFFFFLNCYKHDGYVLNCMWGNSKSYIFDKNFNQK